MNQQALETLRRCYAQSREPVLLLDEQWQIVWQNMPLQIGSLPALLGIPEDSWAYCERTVELSGSSYSLRLNCSREDGLRIAVLHPAPLETLPLDTALVSSAVHSLYTSCSLLHSLFDEYDLYDNNDILASITGNCLRLYRPAFFQREIERCQAGLWQKDGFSARQLLMEIHGEIHRILGRCADVELSLCEEPATVCGDADAFVTAVLSALLLCHREQEHRLAIRLALTCEADACTVTVSITPTPEPRSDGMPGIAEFGSTYPEQRLLELFCKETGGSHVRGSTGETQFTRITLPCTEQPSGRFRSSIGKEQDAGFFSRYEILLARIRHYKLPR